MKDFKCIFKNELTEYLEISRGTISDAALQNTRRILLSFGSLLADENASEISEKTVSQWIKELYLLFVIGRFDGF